MSKYDKAIDVLSNEVLKVGGELYTIEICKKHKDTKFMFEMFGSNIGGKQRQQEFKDLMDAIELLRKHDTPTTEVKDE